jgi:hypothetical protein
MMDKLEQTTTTALRRGSFRALLCALALFGCHAATAAEVYTWTDENGTVHYSDAPPESGQSSTLQVEEIYRPGSADAYARPAAAPAEAPMEAADDAAAPAPETPASAAQQRREQIARERAERQEEAAEAERLCALHRQRVEQMEPARRVFYEDEQGESVRMDDDQRMALIDESKQYLSRNCRD